MTSGLLVLLLTSAAAVLAPRPLPGKVTQAWLRGLDSGVWSLARAVDTTRGLVVMHHEVDTPNENDPGRVSAQRLCGEELTRALPRLQTEAIAAIRSSDTTFCRNRPGPPMCVVGVASEYTTYTHLVFLPGPDGRLRLDAVFYLDGLAQVDAPEPHREQADYVRTQLHRLRTTDCAGKRVAVPADYERLDLERGRK